MAKYYREARNYGIKKERWKEYAYDKLHYDFEKCLRGLEAKLNTITSSRGDTAFVTFSFGCIDNEREDYNMMQADICKYLLQTRINGHGKGKAPAVFPKLVYLYASKNHIKDYQKEKPLKAIQNKLLKHDELLHEIKLLTTYMMLDTVGLSTSRKSSVATLDFIEPGVEDAMKRLEEQAQVSLKHERVRKGRPVTKK